MLWAILLCVLAVLNLSGLRAAVVEYRSVGRGAADDAARRALWAGAALVHLVVVVACCAALVHHYCCSVRPRRALQHDQGADAQSSKSKKNPDWRYPSGRLPPG